jgi:hypothetical protein
MRSDPKPKPFVPMSQRDRADVSGDADRPGARVRAQSLDTQAGMGGLLAEDVIRSTSCGLQFRRQIVIKLPKLRCGAGDHSSLTEVALGHLRV